MKAMQAMQYYLVVLALALILTHATSKALTLYNLSIN